VALIQAFKGAVSGTLADQWKDFFTVPQGVQPTAALFPAVLAATNAGRGVNTDSSTSVITNGSKIVVPEGYGLLTFEDGAITGFASQPGGYIWNSDDINSQSVFVGDGLIESVVRQSWERFKFGGRPTSQQLALFVCLKELPNNRFGTQSQIYWDDAYLNTQVGAVTRGSYTLRIVDPLVFAREFVPARYLQALATFDFTDPSNPAGAQIFSEVVASLAAAFSAYLNDPNKGNRITQIQRDSVGFAECLAQVVEDNYRWLSTRGLSIAKVALVAIDYDENTRELISTIQRADALQGARGNANLQASVAAGLEAAGEVGGAAGIVGIGVASNSVGLSNLQQQPTQPSEPPSLDSELLTRLRTLKGAFEEGLITQQDYDAARAKMLGT